MKQFYLWFAVLSIVLCACEQFSTQQEAKRWMASSGKVKVLCTTGMIADVVSQIGGEEIDVHTLIKGDLDPHSYQLVKGDGEKLEVADIVFYNGLGLEHGPSLRQALKSSPKAVGLGDKIARDHPARILHFEGQRDPHIWMDISLWSETISYIVETLSDTISEKKESFERKGEVLSERMLEEHLKVRKLLHELPAEKRYLVTSHDAFNYFGRAYLAPEGEEQWQARVEAPEGLAPESQLSAADIQQIIDHVAKYNIRVLFPESNLSRDSIRKIIDAGNELGLNLREANMFLYGDAMGPPGSDGDTYLKMIWHNAKTLHKCLGE